MQREIDDLKKRLRRAQRKQTPSSSYVSSNGDGDANYRQRSGTPPSESYSYEEEHSRKRRRRSPSGRGVGTNVMHFHQPTFTIYNGRTDPIKHMSQFKQKMTVHSQDEPLLCRVFPSSLGPMLMRWFDGLRTNSISSFKKFTQSFCSRFITCSRVPQPLDSLLSMTMREGESVKAYVERYWEIFNEIDGDFDEVAIRTFKVGLPPEHGLRRSLTGKPVTSLR